MSSIDDGIPAGAPAGGDDLHEQTRDAAAPAADRHAPNRGRFAPSPTGPLHFGSLIAALGSCLEARLAGGEWLVRMDDLDRARVVPGAADDILRTLELFGFEWDGEVLYQSTRTDAYARAVERLRADGLVYPCACSRREIALEGAPGAEGPIYPGTCRQGLPAGRKARSLRLRTTRGRISIRDRIQGPFHQDLRREVGDFVLRRADGIHAYQLAVVVDDAFQRITQVVRGADLMLSTPRQAYLLRALGSPLPVYGHLPLVLDSGGHKLSKSCAAAPLDPADPLSSLLLAWRFLKQPPFPERPANLAELWSQARATWDPAMVPKRTRIALPTLWS